MHRILLRKVIIDVPTDVHDRAREFWVTAMAATPRRSQEFPEDTLLEHPAATVSMVMQDIGPTPARYHLDIETDDVEPEVSRLIAAGATEVDRQVNWVVLSDPAGLLFCIVPTEGDGFAEQSTVVGD